MRRFEDREQNISLNESKYWKRFFMSNLKIGVEIESCFHGSNPISPLTQYLEPVSDYGKFGKFGINSVKYDGSLNNGAEVCTIGRRVDFINLYEQYKFVTDEMIRLGAYVESRAGLHNHIMLDYGNSWSCLEKPVPDIIFKNFIQLLKNSSPELIFITSTMCQTVPGVNIDNQMYDKAITRCNNFCRNDTLLAYNFIRRSGLDVRDKISPNGGSGSDRYKFANVKFMQFDQTGTNATRFHFELRFPDGSLYPAQMAAQNVMFAAMLLKAIQISEIGIMGMSSEWEETKELMNLIRTDIYGDRCSKPVSDPTIETLKARSASFIDYLKPELDMFDTHVYQVLKLLANEPVSLQRRTKSDKQINKDFDALVENMYLEKTADCAALLEIISLQNIAGFRTEMDLKKQLVETLSITSMELEAMITKIRRNTKLEFDRIIGTYVII